MAHKVYNEAAHFRVCLGMDIVVLPRPVLDFFHLTEAGGTPEGLQGASIQK